MADTMETDTKKISYTDSIEELCKKIVPNFDIKSDKVIKEDDKISLYLSAVLENVRKFNAAPKEVKESEAAPNGVKLAPPPNTQLVNYYLNIYSSCKKYLSHIDKSIFKGISTQGKERYEAVRGIMDKTKGKLKNYTENKKFFDTVTEEISERHNEKKLKVKPVNQQSDKNAQKGDMNERILAQAGTNTDGSVRKGFFTKCNIKSKELKELKEILLNNLKKEPKPKPKSKEEQEQKKDIYYILRTCIGSIDYNNVVKLAHFAEGFDFKKKSSYLDEIQLNIKNNDLAKKIDSYCGNTNKETSSNSQNTGSVNKSLSDGKDNFSEEDFNLFVKYMTPIGKYALKANKMRDAGIKLGKHLEYRNVATSKVARLFDESKLIANTQRAVNENNEEGIFQDFSEGLDISHGKFDDGFAFSDILKNNGLIENGSIVETNITDNKKEVDDLITDYMVNTPGFKKSVTMVAIMDIVCGQIDRHGGNFIYQYDNKGNINGLQGIDNDLAFGNVGINNNGEFNNIQKVYYDMSALNSIKYIDIDQYVKINAVSDEDVETSLKEYLDKDEINAVKTRLQVVKDYINSDNVKKINISDWDKINIELLREVQTVKEVYGKMSVCIDKKIDEFIKKPKEVKQDTKVDVKLDTKKKSEQEPNIDTKTGIKQETKKTSKNINIEKKDLNATNKIKDAEKRSGTENKIVNKIEKGNDTSRVRCNLYVLDAESKEKEKNGSNATEKITIKKTESSKSGGTRDKVKSYNEIIDETKQIKSKGLRIGKDTNAGSNQNVSYVKEMVKKYEEAQQSTKMQPSKGNSKHL